MTAVLTIRSAWKAVPLSFAVLAAACAPGAAPQRGPELGAEVTARWTKAFDAGDAAGLAALYAENARSMPPGAILEGRGDIEAYWRADIGEGGATTRLAVTDAIAAGDVLQVQGTYEVLGAENASLANGQFQQMWLRENGDWRLQHEMWRMDPGLVRSLDVAQELTAAWTRAYNAGDARALVNLYSKDAVLSTVQEGSFTSPMAIESFWERDFGGGKPSSTLTLTDVYLSGELAHLEGEYAVTDRAGTTEGRYVQLWMREGNAWRVHREMWLR